MKCIYCGSKTKVSNSRPQKKSNQIWRRRRCTACQGVFTTNELLDTRGAFVFMSNTGVFEPFSRTKLFISIYEACKHQKNAEEAADALTETVLSKILPRSQQARISRTTLIQVTTATLAKYDTAAGVSYKAFHPLSDVTSS